ncbi:MAG: ECF transporter S component [Clostridia bacterium]|nr:ECF transporter S component [Clostridia bacterium]
MIVIRQRRLRRMLQIGIPFVLVPLLVLLGALVFDQQRHLIVSFGVAVLSLLLFAAGFEKRVTGTRRLVLVAAMTALCVVGRLIPYLKPVTAITALTAIYLGPEAGFLTGSLSALISNFYFGQGPWTPFQMLGWGLLGLFAGYLAKPLTRSRILLILYGIFAGVAYSVLMDVWTVLWYNDSFDWTLYGAALVTAIPYTVSYALSNVLFLWLLADPIGRKLNRVKVKYGV